MDSHSIKGKDKARGGRSGNIKHQWTDDEDKLLIECLLDICASGSWKSDKGTFKAGYCTHLERLMKQKNPSSQVVTKNIESRIKLMKQKYHAIVAMRGYKGTGSGFYWDDKNKIMTCDNDFWADWIMAHPAATGLRGKACPYFDDWCVIFGKDGAIGDEVENIETEGGEDSAKDLFEDVNWTTQLNDNALARNLDGNEEVEANADTIAMPRATPNVTPITHPMGATNSDTSTEVTSRKRKSRTTDDILLEGLDKMTAYNRNVNKALGRIADYFDGLARGRSQRTGLITELRKIGGLSNVQIFDAGEALLKDDYRLDLFYSLPNDMRKAYLLRIIGGSSSR